MWRQMHRDGFLRCLCNITYSKWNISSGEVKITYCTVIYFYFFNLAILFLFFNLIMHKVCMLIATIKVYFDRLIINSNLNSGIWHLSSSTTIIRIRFYLNSSSNNFDFMEPSRLFWDGQKLKPVALSFREERMHRKSPDQTDRRAL